jgi:hypothetical protein
VEPRFDRLKAWTATTAAVAAVSRSGRSFRVSATRRVRRRGVSRAASSPSSRYASRYAICSGQGYRPWRPCLPRPIRP